MALRWGKGRKGYRSGTVNGKRANFIKKTGAGQGERLKKKKIQKSGPHTTTEKMPNGPKKRPKQNKKEEEECGLRVVQANQGVASEKTFKWKATPTAGKEAGVGPNCTGRRHHTDHVSLSK